MHAGSACNRYHSQPQLITAIDYSNCQMTLSTSASCEARSECMGISYQHLVVTNGVNDQHHPAYPDVGGLALFVDT
jgi:hypothetical protein